MGTFGKVLMATHKEVRAAAGRARAAPNAGCLPRWGLPCALPRLRCPAGSRHDVWNGEGKRPCPLLPPPPPPADRRRYPLPLPLPLFPAPPQTGEVVAIKKIQVGEKGEVRQRLGAQKCAVNPMPRPPVCLPDATPAPIHALQGVNVTALREVKLLRELRSPHLVRLLEVLPQKKGINLVCVCGRAVVGPCARGNRC